MSEIYRKAKNKIKNDQKYKPLFNIVVGPTGPAGPRGTSISILGSFDTFKSLIDTCPHGEDGNCYIVEDRLYTWSSTSNTWVDVGKIGGPMGPTGPQGIPGEQGKMGPQGIMGNPGIQGPTGPQGMQGEQGLQGPQGEIGPTGPTGPSGKDGTGVTILGSFTTEQELREEHPTGMPGESYLVGPNLYVWSNENGEWINVGHIQGPIGPQGERGLQGEIGPTGPMGPTGPQGEQGNRGPQGIQGIPGIQGEQGLQGPQGEIGPTGPAGPAGKLAVPIANFITTNEDLENGDEVVLPGDRIPIETMTIDTDSRFYVSNQNNTITFLKAGIYKIIFIVQAHVKEPLGIIPGTNIISMGFKKTCEETVYAANSVWVANTTPISIVGQGIINLPYPKEIFELVNLGKYEIYVQSPSLDYLETESSFASPAVSIMIETLQSYE